MPISRARRTPRSGLGLATEEHRTTAWRILRRLNSRPPARTCKGAIRDLTLVSRAKDEAEDSGDLALSRLAIDALRDIRRSISRSCLEKDARPVELDGLFPRLNPRLNARLNADLNRLETMKTRGYKSGKRSWIDVLPAGGPRMRVTHEVLDGLEGLGSSFALMWAAAGAVALVVLSDAQRQGVRTERPFDPAREAVFQDLNRARKAQGLPPLSR